MGTGLFGIGVSGLAAAQAGLVTTGHNIANANTPGYHRQVVAQSNAPALFTGSGFMGRGVQVDTVRRVYNDFLDGQVSRAQAQASYYSTYSTQLSQIDRLLSDPATGLAPELKAFFEGIHAVSAAPGSIPARETMLSAATSLANRFHTIDTRLTELERSVNSQISSTVETVNTYAREIAQINARITIAQTTPGQQANDLLDTRDHLVNELGKLVGAQATVRADGTADVSIGNGQVLVLGSQAFSLAAVQSTTSPGRIEVAFAAGANPVPLSDQVFNGGSLGALMAFRGGPLTNAQNDLGRIAVGLVENVNAQHRLGQDLRGALGGDFFSPLQPHITARNTNTGNANINVSFADASALTASDYRLTYTGGAYQLTRLRDNTTTTLAGLPQTVDGITIQLAGGAPANGDSFLIEPTRLAAYELNVAVRDPASIAAAAPIRTATGSANVGTGRVSEGVVNAPVNVNLTQPVSIVFTSATTFNVTGTGTGNPTGVTFTPGADITYNGWTVRITGTPTTGDSFTVGANTGGTADNRNAARMADLQVANLLAGGSASLQTAYGQLTSLVGNTVREVAIAEEAQGAIATRAREMQQAMSGVNLDEEAANLLRYQQAYQAAGKVVQVAATLFDTILGLGGR